MARFLAYGFSFLVLGNVFVFPSIANPLATLLIFVFSLKSRPPGKVKTLC